MVLRISEEHIWTGKYSAFTRPYEKLLIPTDLAIVHITLLVVVRIFSSSQLADASASCSTLRQLATYLATAGTGPLATG